VLDCELEISDSGKRSGTGSCEHGNEILGSVEIGQFI